MEEVTNQFGNSITLLIERIFWLGMGGFFALAFITSTIRGLNKNKIRKTNASAKQLKNLAEKAIQKNCDRN